MSKSREGGRGRERGLSECNGRRHQTSLSETLLPVTLYIWSRLFSLSPHQKYHLSLSAITRGLSRWSYGGHMDQIPSRGLLHVFHLRLVRNERAREKAFPSRENNMENEPLIPLPRFVFALCHLCGGNKYKSEMVEKWYRWITRTGAQKRSNQSTD